MIDFLHVQLRSGDWPRQQISLRQSQERINHFFTKLDYKLVDISGGSSSLEIRWLEKHRTPALAASSLLGLFYDFVPLGVQRSQNRKKSGKVHSVSSISGRLFGSKPAASFLVRLLVVENLS